MEHVPCCAFGTTVAAHRMRRFLRSFRRTHPSLDSHMGDKFVGRKLQISRVAGRNTYPRPTVTSVQGGGRLPQCWEGALKQLDKRPLAVLPDYSNCLSFKTSPKFLFKRAAFLIGLSHTHTIPQLHPGRMPPNTIINVNFAVLPHSIAIWKWHGPLDRFAAVMDSKIWLLKGLEPNFFS